MNRIFIASLLVIFITSMTDFLLTAISSFFDEFATIKLSVLIAAIAVVVSAVIVAVWVVPIHLILIKYNVACAGWYVLLSLVPGLVIPVIIVSGLR